MIQIKTDPKGIFQEYESGNDYKAGVGSLGIHEQAKRNERFFVGDQWYGAQCGNERPLVRQNIIRRIGEYKIASVGASPVTVNYSADGIPNTNDIKKQSADMRTAMIGGEWTAKGAPDNVEVATITDAMTAYQKICAERVRFNIKNEQLLRNAYISGTGIAYTYWDDDIDTGLYADEARTAKIKGDIAFDVLDVENVVFGDPNDDDVQRQPYIILAQRLDVDAVRREARRNRLADNDIVPDGATQYNAGDRGENEPKESRRVTVLTKLYKEWDKDDSSFKVMAVKTTEKAVVRKPWDIGLTMYPIATFCWERRRSCAYGDSEITYLTPNQIAINRIYTSGAWAAISTGMPKTLINAGVIEKGTKITNDPGQIIRLDLPPEVSPSQCIHYAAPPSFAGQYLNIVNDLIGNSLSTSGANDAALGDIRPDNASAIIQMREAAMQPMQIYQNRYYAYIEEVARIWADFWINKYGNRSLRVETRNGTEYVPFDANRYKGLVLTARVDVGASTLWGEAVVISTLDALLGAQIITPEQYLERLPKGIVPKLTELIDDLRAQSQQNADMQADQDDTMRQFAEQYPAEYEQFMGLPAEEQQAMMRQLMGGAV